MAVLGRPYQAQHLSCALHGSGLLLLQVGLGCDVIWEGPWL